MGKHSAPKRASRLQLRGVVTGLTSRSVGRHGASNEVHRASAADVLREKNRGPVMAAIAIPTAAAAAVLVAGVINTPAAQDSTSAQPVESGTPVAVPKESSSGQALSTQTAVDKATKAVKKSSPITAKLKQETPELPAGTKKSSKASGQSGSCQASMYGNGDGTDGGPTASGERFNANAMTAANKELPLGSIVKVTNKGNGKSVTVRINDRGPYISGRCLDLSVAAMKAVGGYSAGTISVTFKVL